MKILVLNAGGSSIKYALINMANEKKLACGLIDRIHSDKATLVHKDESGHKLERSVAGLDYAGGIRLIIQTLVEQDEISRLDELGALAHKVAHGGSRFRDAVLITDEVISGISELSTLAPVHNPHSLKAISICRELFPSTQQIAAFETGFHQTIPDYAYMYGVPFDWYQHHGVRKYGFHGASHSYVTDRVGELLGIPKEELKIVSCHLGSGTSVAAIEFGRSVDVSSGFTPQSGTIMSTRPGDFDPWVFPYMMGRENVSADQLSAKLIEKGGILGISGTSGDMRDLLGAVAEGNDRARLAVDVFCYQVKKYIGSCVAIMNGVDVLCFTGGIGENSPEIRQRITANTEYLGISIDHAKNVAAGVDAEITTTSSKVKVFAISTDEELIVARKAMAILQGISLVSAE